MSSFNIDDAPDSGGDFDFWSYIDQSQQAYALYYR